MSAIPLSLPRLVLPPAKLTLTHGGSSGGKVKALAHAFIDAGLIQAHHIHAAKSPGDAILSALRERCRALSTLRFFPDTEVQVTERLFRHYYETASNRNEEDAGFIFVSGSRQVLAVGGVLEQMDRRHPGLAAFVLTTLNDASAQLGHWILQPADFLEMMRWRYWHGEEDESTYLAYSLEEAKETLEEKRGDHEWAKSVVDLADKPAELAARLGVTTRAEVDALAPKWAWCPYEQRKLEPTKPATLKHPAFRAATELIAAMRKVKQRDLPNHGGATRHLSDLYLYEMVSDLSSPVVLRWTRDDFIGDLWDGAAQDAANSGEEIDLASVIAFEPNPEAAAEALTRLDHMVRILTLIDRLLGTFTEPKPLR